MAKLTFFTLILLGTLASLHCVASLECICAQFIRPFSDNAYFWENVCGSTADPNSLVTDGVEFYDPEYGCDTPEYTLTCCNRTIGCGDFADCDGPETALPGPYIYNIALAAGWKVASQCAVDTPERVLSDVIVSYLPSTTPYSCTTLCASKGYTYAGVEYGDECYCGTGYAGGVSPAVADVGDCDMRCAGDYIFTCGGSWRMQIYTSD